MDKLIDDLKMPRLGKYGLKVVDIAAVCRETGIKNNPVKLDRDDLEKILESRL